MATFNLDAMKVYLSRSISSLNENKLHGLLAEIDFRNYLNSIGFGDKVSIGGWIARNEGPGTFGHNTIALFPNTIQPDQDYGFQWRLPNPSHGLHTICATFHQIGIRSYFCVPNISSQNDSSCITWQSIQLGLPTQQAYQQFPGIINGFNPRGRAYTFLRYHTDVSSVPISSIPEEFTKEHLRVTFQNAFMSEISDIDGILWGNQYTYPIEIKEKTPAHSNKLGDFFGLDVGPFVKLAFYAAKRGNLHSIFVVKEITDTLNRELVKWWFIKFENLAQFASWNPQGGGTNMQGGRSSVIIIPKSEFQELNAASISTL